MPPRVVSMGRDAAQRFSSLVHRPAIRLGLVGAIRFSGPTWGSSFVSMVTVWWVDECSDGNYFRRVQSVSLEKGRRVRPFSFLGSTPLGRVGRFQVFERLGTETIPGQTAGERRPAIARFRQTARIDMQTDLLGRSASWARFRYAGMLCAANNERNGCTWARRQPAQGPGQTVRSAAKRGQNEKRLATTRFIKLYKQGCCNSDDRLGRGSGKETLKRGRSCPESLASRDGRGTATSRLALLHQNRVSFCITAAPCPGRGDSVPSSRIETQVEEVENQAVAGLPHRSASPGSGTQTCVKPRCWQVWVRDIPLK